VHRWCPAGQTDYVGQDVLIHRRLGHTHPLISLP
jgi:hypothetical protein